MMHDLIRRVETLGNPKIVVVGDLILDRYIWGLAERISQEAPVPLLRPTTANTGSAALPASPRCCVLLVPKFA